MLADRDVLATFFVVGDSMNTSTAQFLASMSAAGHSVPDHSRSRAYLASLPEVQVAERLTSTSDRVEQATGIRPSCFPSAVRIDGPRVRSVAASPGCPR